MSEHLNAKIGGVPNTKIHIRNIPPHITETHLRSILGNVAYIKDLCYFNKNKKQMNMYPNSKVYNTALITFNTHEEAVNILQNIQNLIDSSGEEKPIEAKFAIPSNVINNNNNNNNNNNMNSGNLFSRNNYGLPYHNNNTNNTTNNNNNNVNNFSDNYNDGSNNHANNNSSNNNNGGNYANGENSMTNENGAVAGTNNSNFLSRSVRQRNNNNNNSNSKTMGGIGNKQMNALNSNGMSTNNYNMFMKYNNNNRKNDSTQGMGAENEANNMNSSIRQPSYQPNCFQPNGGNSSNSNNGMNNNNNNNNNTNNVSNMTNVNPMNNGGTSASSNVGLYTGGDSFLWDNENEKNVDGLSLWESYKDSNNNVYYYNNLTKHSQWKKPIHPSKLFQYNSMEKVKQNGPQGSNLFIFHIPSEWNDVDLFEHFCCFGNIISSKIQRDSTGRNSGFGFVSYDNTVSAQRAIQHMNGYFVNNKYLKVQLKKGEVVNEAQA